MRRAKKLSMARAALLSELVKSDRGVLVSDRYPPARKLVCYGLARWGDPGRLFATGDGYAEFNLCLAILEAEVGRKRTPLRKTVRADSFRL